MEQMLGKKLTYLLTYLVNIEIVALYIYAMEVTKHLNKQRAKQTNSDKTKTNSNSPQNTREVLLKQRMN